MKKYLACSAVVALAVLGIAAPTSAHHAVNAQFDVSQEIKVTGTLVKLEHINPHSYWTFMLINPTTGKAEEWSFGGGAPALLRRAGLKVKEDIKIGDKYVFAVDLEAVAKFIGPSRNGSNTGFLRVLWIGEKRIGISGNG